MGRTVQLFLLQLLAVKVSQQNSERPNIVIILADDLGWNDVGFHGSNQISTPNIDALAYNGVILNSHYVPALCTPSRASLLTGKYPTTLGMQHLVILADEPWGLPLEETLLPERLRTHGYSTHAIGKWHLGFHKREFTPTYRGFDTFLGYWNGYQDYYDHTMEATDGQSVPVKGYDMRRGLEVDYTSKGRYSTDLYTDEAVSIIHRHNASQGPLFMYLAHLAPHAGNSDKPYQAPDEEVAKHAHIKDPERRVYAAMVSRLDQGVGLVMKALRERKLLENSIVLFLSDNGAVTFGAHSNHGSNYPLRGLKESPWEGGVRGAAVLWSPLLNRTQRVSQQLMHMSDWLPTLYSAAGLDSSELGEVDGVDMWDALSNDLKSPRTEVFNNYDEIENYSSLRVGDWKYVAGTAQDGEVDDWYGDSGEDSASAEYDVRDVLLSKANIALSGLLTDHQLLHYGSVDAQLLPDLINPQTMRNLRKESTISCENLNFNFTEVEKEPGCSPVNDSITDFTCNPLIEVCLFNLNFDPCEKVNLAKVLPGLVERLEERLKELKKSVAKPLNTPGDPLAHPSYHNNIWTTWNDVHNTAKPYDFSFFDNLILRMISSPFLFILYYFTQLFLHLAKFMFVFILSMATVVILLFILTSFRKCMSLNVVFTLESLLPWCRKTDNASQSSGREKQ